MSLLSLGSVVALGKNEEVNAMIIGYYPIDKAENVLKEYVGVLYPAGISLELRFITFNYSEITKVLFPGYENEKSKAFNEMLSALVTAKNQPQ